MHIDFRKKIYNSIYYPYREMTDYDIELYYGSSGSGKSVFVIGQKTLRCMLKYKGFNPLIVRKVAKTLRGSCFTEMRKAILHYGLSHLFTISQTDKVIKCINGNMCQFLGFDDKEKIKSATAETGPITTIIFEEASEFGEEIIEFATTRLRGKVAKGIKKQIWLMFNPISKDHWLKRRFFDIKEDRTLIVHSTYKDNKFLDEDDRRKLEAMKEKDEYYYKVYCLGEWGVLNRDQLVFNNVEVHDFDYTLDQLDNVRWGWDYGFNHASALMGCGFRDGELYIFDEYYAKRMTHPQFHDLIKQEGFDPSDKVIQADSARADLIEESRNRGFEIQPSKKGAGSRDAGKSYLIGLPKIHIHRTKCPNAAREFLDLKYRIVGEKLTDDVIKINDDCYDAVRYATEEFWNNRHGEREFEDYNYVDIF